jgi:hypothetical protein
VTDRPRPGRRVHVHGEQAAGYFSVATTRCADAPLVGVPVWDAEAEYVDLIMALGAVALGYRHPEINAAAVRAIDDGVVGPVPPESKPSWRPTSGGSSLGGADALPQVRGRGDGGGAPRADRDRPGGGARLWVSRVARLVPGPGRAWRAAGRAGCMQSFRSTTLERTREMIRRAGDTLAAVVFGPVILAPPDPRGSPCSGGDRAHGCRAHRRRDQDGWPAGAGRRVQLRRVRTSS